MGLSQNFGTPNPPKSQWFRESFFQLATCHKSGIPFWDKPIRQTGWFFDFWFSQRYANDMPRKLNNQTRHLETNGNCCAIWDILPPFLVGWQPLTRCVWWCMMHMFINFPVSVTCGSNRFFFFREIDGRIMGLLHFTIYTLLWDTVICCGYPWIF